MGEGPVLDGDRAGGGLDRVECARPGDRSEGGAVPASAGGRDGHRPLPCSSVRVVCGEPGDRVPGRAGCRRAGSGNRDRDVRRSGGGHGLPGGRAVERLAVDVRPTDGHSSAIRRQGRGRSGRGTRRRRVLLRAAHRRRVPRPGAVHRATGRSRSADPARRDAGTYARSSRRDPVDLSGTSRCRACRGGESGR